MDNLLTLVGEIQAYIKFVIESFNAYARENQIIAGAISLWFLGTASFLFRGFPRFLSENFLKHTTTQLTMMSSSDSFHNFAAWYYKNGYSCKSRRIKITNGRWGDGKSIKSLGYGRHYIWFKKRLLMIEMESVEASATERDKDKITIAKLGRSHKIFNILFDEIKEKEASNDSTILKKYSDDYWQMANEQRPRSFDSIFLSRGVKERLIDHLNRFKDREHWYLDHGIPYQTGIILYGPPGTGKTSVIKAIANYLNYSLNIINPSSLFKIQEAMLSLPEKSIVMIEDIDRDPATNISQNSKGKGLKPRVRDRSSSNKDGDEEKTSFVFSLTSMSDVLNAIDGVHSVHGRILVVTTNNIEKLDPALLRPGRIDLKLYMCYADHFILSQFVESFYPDKRLPDGFKVESCLSSAEVQNRIQENLDSFQDFLNSVSADKTVGKA